MGKLDISKPSKFVMGVRNAGVDTCNAHFKGQFENSNPIILGMQICNLMGDQFAGEQYKPLFEYWLACRILKGLDFDKKRLFEDIDRSIERIKGFELKPSQKRTGGVGND